MWAYKYSDNFVKDYSELSLREVREIINEEIREWKEQDSLTKE